MSLAQASMASWRYKHESVKHTEVAAGVATRTHSKTGVQAYEERCKAERKRAKEIARKKRRDAIKVEELPAVVAANAPAAEPIRVVEFVFTGSLDDIRQLQQLDA